MAPFRLLLPSLFLGLFSLLRSTAALSTLTDDDLRNIPSPGDDFDIHNGKLLAPILIPRVPGSEGSLKTQQHFVDFFQSNLPEWQLLWHNSTGKTPATGDKDIPFVNLIFRRDPPGSQVGDVARLTLVAHYDSKLTPAGFIGAIDSAAPCAMLLHVARSIEEALKARWEIMAKTGEGLDGLEAGVGVQILLLDGEEAFVQWSETDSLYGARYVLIGLCVLYANFCLWIANKGSLGRWLKTGSRNIIRPCRISKHHSIPLVFLSCWTSLARQCQLCHPTS